MGRRRSMADGAMGDRAGATSPECAEQPGAVILARHGQPALSRRRDAVRRRVPRVVGRLRDRRPRRGPGAAEPLRHAAERAGFIIASTRLRSVETARALAVGPGLRRGPAVHRGAAAAAALAALAEAQPAHLGRRLAVLVVVCSTITTSRRPARQAQARADEAARQLIALAAGGQDVLVVAHGFFNTMIGRALRRLGWRCVADGGFSYWSARRFELSQPLKYSRRRPGPSPVADAGRRSLGWRVQPGRRDDGRGRDRCPELRAGAGRAGADRGRARIGQDRSRAVDRRVRARRRAEGPLRSQTEGGRSSGSRRSSSDRRGPPASSRPSSDAGRRARSARPARRRDRRHWSRWRSTSCCRAPTARKAG